MSVLNFILRGCRHYKNNLNIIVKAKMIYFFPFLFKKTEENKLYSFMAWHRIRPFPYKFTLKYKNIQKEVFYGEENMPYILHNSKKLYFPIDCPEKDIHFFYRNLLIEQDEESPHRYVENYNELKDKTLFDIGAAEAIFSLDVIDIVNHIYIFEYEDKWIKAIEKTFAPWKEKVTIVKKYVCDLNNENSITLDSFLEDKSVDNIFIKMDIEGAEQSALKGGGKTLSQINNIQLAICTYHRTSDAEEVEKVLLKHSFKTEFTKGYMFFEKEFRKGIIRGVR